MHLTPRWMNRLKNSVSSFRLILSWATPVQAFKKSLYRIEGKCNAGKHLIPWE